ncbi:MAG: hypothetical protein R3295_01660, partial [Marinobacter sp.]|nr:hypothetical protein [Marinobacter sp.]
LLLQISSEASCIGIVVTTACALAFIATIPLLNLLIFTGQAVCLGRIALLLDKTTTCGVDFARRFAVFREKAVAAGGSRGAPDGLFGRWSENTHLTLYMGLFRMSITGYSGL